MNTNMALVQVALNIMKSKVEFCTFPRVYWELLFIAFKMYLSDKIKWNKKKKEDFIIANNFNGCFNVLSELWQFNQKVIKSYSTFRSAFGHNFKNQLVISLDYIWEEWNHIDW